jgi:hypothetical protein
MRWNDYNDIIFMEDCIEYRGRYRITEAVQVSAIPRLLDHQPYS